MISPQQLLESFLQEKAAVYAEANKQLSPVYTKYFGEPLSQHARDFMLGATVQAVVEDVKQSPGSASAVTREHFRSADIRTRYHLAAIDEAWRIIRIEHECFLCRGTGQSGNSRCKKCDGEGWHDRRKDTV
jgi:hypothetical protein